MTRRALPCFLALMACSSWASVRDEAREMKTELGACVAGDTCVRIAGRGRDCTGVLACAFAVRADHAAEAETRARDLAEDSRGHGVCAQAFCDDADEAICDVAIGRCVLTTAHQPSPSPNDPPVLKGSSLEQE